MFILRCFDSSLVSVLIYTVHCYYKTQLTVATGSPVPQVNGRASRALMPHDYNPHPSPHVQSAPHLQSVSHIYIPCPVCTEAQSVKTNVLVVSQMFPAHVQILSHLYSPCSESSQFLQQKSWQNPHLYSTSTVHVQSVHHLSCPCTPYLLLMSCQNNTFPVHYQSHSYLYCPCPVTALICCSHPVRKPPFCLCLVSYPTCNSVRMPHFLPMPSWYTTSLAQVQSVPHLSCPCQKIFCLHVCPVRVQAILPIIIQWGHDLVPK